MSIIKRLFGEPDQSATKTEYHYECRGCGEQYETSRIVCDNCGAPVRELN